MRQRIVLLHATQVAFTPIHQAFQGEWNEAEVIDILDEGLSIDRAKEKQLSDDLISRFVQLGHYAYSLQPDAILITCSAFGPAIERLASELPIPVIKPNEAMFQAALKMGKKIGMLATFKPAIDTMQQEFEIWAAENHIDASLKVEWVPDAIEALRQGDKTKHNELVASYTDKLSDCDALLLAHFSTSLALPLVQSRTNLPVLTAPHSAVNLLRSMLEK